MSRREPGSTAKTAPKTLGRIHRETGGVVRVEGATGLVVLALSLEFMAVGAEKL